MAAAVTNTCAGTSVGRKLLSHELHDCMTISFHICNKLFSEAGCWARKDEKDGPELHY